MTCTCYSFTYNHPSKFGNSTPFSCSYSSSLQSISQITHFHFIHVPLTSSPTHLSLEITLLHQEFALVSQCSDVMNSNSMFDIQLLAFLSLILMQISNPLHRAEQQYPSYGSSRYTTSYPFVRQLVDGVHFSELPSSSASQSAPFQSNTFPREFPLFSRWLAPLSLTFLMKFLFLQLIGRSKPPYIQLSLMMRVWEVDSTYFIFIFFLFVISFFFHFQNKNPKLYSNIY